jgi:hypothetical protein
VLSGGVVKGGSTGIWKFVRSLGVEADSFSQASFAEKICCWQVHLGHKIESQMRTENLCRRVRGREFAGET